MEKRSDNIDSLIVKFLDNEATTEERAKIYMWLNSSENNNRYFSSMVKTWEHSHIFLQDEKRAEKQYSRFMQILSRRKIRRIVYGISAVAAIALLVVVIRFFIPSPAITLLSEATFDQKKEITLPDGSLVWLNRNSSIQYPKTFKGHRIVYLSGEAYFDVTHYKNKPFVVETSDLIVSVLGTRFVVTDFGDENIAETVLESGSIQLETQKTNQEFILQPGQMVSLDKQLGDARLTTVDVHNFTHWINNRLVFENTLLKDVFIQLEKWYGIYIRCENPTILQTPVTFTLDQETKEELLNTLQVVVPFTWKEKPTHGERTTMITITPVK